jgi:hypothetical protein
MTRRRSAEHPEVEGITAIALSRRYRFSSISSSFPEKQESQTALVLSSAATVRSAWSGMPAFPQE